jgi:hypothetical protein
MWYYCFSFSVMNFSVMNSVIVMSVTKKIKNVTDMTVTEFMTEKKTGRKYSHNVDTSQLYTKVPICTVLL